MPSANTQKRGTSDLRPVISALFPHPPIIIPAIGRERLETCRATVDACRRLAARIVKHRPERLFLVSPHTPRESEAFGLVTGPRLIADFSRFGAPRQKIDVPNDELALEAIVDKARQLGSRPGSNQDLRVMRLKPQSLDHGAAVPLFFLAEAGWNGPTLVASLPWRHESKHGADFGRLVGQALRGLESTVATIASGDMSHRCLPDAPAGFHPRAVEFDRELKGLLAAGRLDAIADIDPTLRELAAEDTSEAVNIIGATHGFRSAGAEVLSYEHPFGVGYLVAVLFDSSSSEDRVSVDD